MSKAFITVLAVLFTMQASASTFAGIVKLISHVRGYGYVTTLDGTTDVFFKVTDLERSGINYYNVKKGTKLCFDITQDRIGDRATNFVLAEDNLDCATLFE